MGYHRFAVAIVGVSLCGVLGSWPDQAAAQAAVDVGGVRVQVGERLPAAQNVEVLTRGPVHEAFAQPVILDEGAGFTITRKPPAPLDEIVPDQKPQGNHVLWIPGYWSWDPDRNDFIWVSGCWRAVPPKTSWVPGYWAAGQGIYQWIAGFWTAADAEEIEYLPAPPVSLEEGPPSGGSSDNIWIPGCWVRHQGRYAWRPGFWEAARPDWVWDPAHYVGTPRGWIYVDGFWDYPLGRRGMAFLPVYCPPGVYGRADFRYAPDMVLDLGALTQNLFSSPQRHQYYFGDYYGPEYAREGFYPWYEARDHHDWYDPIFVHQQWQHRDDRGWADNQRTQYARRTTDQTLRPARTYEAMQAQIARLPEKDRSQVQMARPMRDVVSEKALPFKIDAVDAKTREATASLAKNVHAYKDQRAQWEMGSAPRVGSEPMSPEPKSPEPKSPEPKSPEPKSPEPKSPEPKSPEPKSPEPKSMAAPRDVVPIMEPATLGEVVKPQDPARTEPTSLKEMQTPAPKHALHPPLLPWPPGRSDGATGRDVQPEKVKIPKPPIAVREPLIEKELTPPARPKPPEPDPTVQPRPTKDAADHSKDKDNSDKDKPESPRK